MMKANRWCALFAVLMGLLSPLPLAAQGSGGYPARPGEVILKFKRGAGAHDRDAILADLGAAGVRHLRGADAEHVRITKFSVDRAIARYRAHPKIEFIEPNYIYRTVAVPNDPNFSQLWGLQNLGQTGGLPGADIDATLAWDVFTGSDVLVAITDTGMDWTHPDLAPNAFVNVGEIAGNGIDDDGNGFVDDVRGWDFVNNDNDPIDDAGHGTHVSGTVGAVGNNGIGVSGVNWHVKLLPVKFLDAFGNGSTEGAVAAIDYAVRMGARVINASWGGGGPSEALRLAIAAADSAGVLFVAAAGNAGQNNDAFPNYPSNLEVPNIVAVAASDAFDRRPFWSNYGATTVDLAAPGENIYSTFPGGYGYLSGTSMATPHVSGALALILGRFPAMSGADAKALLLGGVDVLPSLAGLVATGGRLNAFTPIREPDEVPPAAILDLQAADPNGTRVTLQWTATGDDGAVGTASRYEVRYSTSPIDEANFGSASLATGAPHPGSAGSAEQMRVSGLAFLTTYHFAVKAFDEFGNPSPLSNVVTGTTLGPPDIAVSPDALQVDLLTGQTATRVITVTNSGPAELNLQVAIQAAPQATTTPIGPRIIGTFSIPTTPPELTTAANAGPQYPVSATPYTEGSAPARSPLSLDSLRLANIFSGGLRVLLLHTGDVSEIRALLAGFPDITAVDEFAANAATPPLSQLLAYDAVIVGTNFAFGDPVGIGNVLADYVDNGGGVVLTLASFISGWGPQGRFLSGGYSPFPPGVGPVGSSSLGTFNADHPIMADVTTATGSLLGDVSLSSGSELVASWTNGEPLVATKGHVAAVNVFVAASGYWTGDIPLLLHNAAFWAGGTASWLSVDPDTVVVPAGGQVGLVATFDATDLDGGDYENHIVVSSDDPDEGTVPVPARLHVTGVPDLAVEGEMVVVESAVGYSTDGARTAHRLPVTVPVPAGIAGTMELVADGDYGDSFESATAIVEGTTLGSVGAVGSDCLTASGSFPVNAAQLATWVADGAVDAEVQNTPDVNVFCSINRHTLRLLYRRAVDRLDFGSLFVGLNREMSLTVRNLGSAPLEVTSITSDRAEFVPGAATLTVAPRRTQVLVVRFQPGSAETFEGTLRLQSNDPDLPLLSIPMAGTGLNPPVAGVQPASFTSTLPEGDEETQTLRILNSGLSPLEFSLRVLAAGSGTALVPFAGLSQAVTGASNNPAPAAGGSPPAAKATESGRSNEPAFRAAAAELGQLQSSPAPLTCVAGDAAADLIYAQANQGTAFFRYRAASDTWESLRDAPIYSGNNGGAALLNGRVYTTYTGNGFELGIYDIAANAWTSVPHPLGVGTGNIASDGSRYLYLAVGFRLLRYEPSTGGVLELAPPPFYFEPWGGLQHLAGKLYGHQGNGQMGFAVYDVGANAWVQLPPAPAGVVLGAAIDPLSRRYVAYGSYGGSNLYQYSIDSGSWSVSTNPFFPVSDGGLAWLSGSTAGIYFVQGEGGTGFARLVEEVEFLSVNPSTGVVPPLGAVDVGVRFVTGDLLGGTYHATIAVASNDPVTPEIAVPATLTVIGVPNIALEGESVMVESSASYLSDGALTTHRLPATVPAGTSGAMELVADGDYGDFVETATLTVEGTTLGAVGRTGYDCLAASGTFAVSAGQLAAWLADGAVDAQVQNTPDVNVFCTTNRHTVRLRYQRPADRLDFGSLFVGLSREWTITVRNRGSLALEVTSITSDRGEFVPAVAALTVPPRSALPLMVTFHPGSAEAFEATLRLQSNDPDHPLLSIPMTGTGLVPPDIALVPAALDASLFTGGTENQTLTIQNTGGSDLTFSVDIADAAVSVQQHAQVMMTKGEPSVQQGGPAATSRGGPDVFGYRWMDSDEPGGPAFNWVEISGVGTTVPYSGDDWNYGPLPIGFSFPFYGQSFSSFRVCSNGWISFTSTSGQFGNQPLPSLFAPENLLSAFWADLYTGVGTVFYHNDGTRLIVEYRNVTYLGGGVPFTFEIVLYPSGRIVYQYLNVGGTQSYASVGIQNAARDDGLNISYNVPYVHDGLAIEIGALPPWLSVAPLTGVVPAGGHLDLDVRFDATGLIGGDYQKSVVITSNDPDETPAAVPAHLHVTGAPDIALSRSALDFGAFFLGLARAETLVVSNEGTDLLTVSGITASRPEYETDAAGGFTLAPRGSRPVIVTFRPTAPGPAPATLTVHSDDPDEAELPVTLAGTGVVPPDIAVAPTALDASLFTGGAATRTLTIENTGGSDLTFSLTPFAPPDSTPPAPAGTGADVPYSTGDPATGRTPRVAEDTGPLALAVERPHMNAGGVLVIADGGTQDDVSAVLGGAGYLVTQVVDDAFWDGSNPSPQGFGAVVLLDGVDYGDDMPLGGQQALMTYVSQGGGLILTEWIAYEVETGHYASMLPLIPMTRQGGYEGFFTFDVVRDHPVTAGMSPAFAVETALSGGFANSGTTLVRRRDDGSAAVVVKEFGAGRIVQFAAAGNYDGRRPFMVEAMQRLLVNAADWVGRTAWLSVSPTSGTVAAGGRVDLEARFDALGLPGGDYRQNVVIWSNDPDEPAVVVPVNLHVTGAPDIVLSGSALDFGSLFIGLARPETLVVRNVGTEPLSVSGITASRPEYETDAAAGFGLAPGESRQVIVTFRPAVAGPAPGTLTVHSDDPDEGESPVALAGIGVIPPDIALAPTAIAEDLMLGGTSSRPLRIANDGESPLIVELGIRLPAIAASAPLVGIASVPGGAAATPIGTAEKAKFLESYRSSAASGAGTDPGRRATTTVTATPRATTAAVAPTALPPGAFVLFFDDMEGGVGGWSHYPTDSANTDQWGRTTSRSGSGTWSWNVSQHPLASSDALQSPAIDLGAVLDATLTFQHWYDFDDCSGDLGFEPDGGLVEVSTDGGAHWQQIDPVGGYPYILDDICGNPLAYRPAYSHASGAGGFVAATFDLTPFVGQTVLLRFHAGWDCGNCGFNEGWFIDDVAVYASGPRWVSVSPAAAVIEPHATAVMSVSFDTAALAVGSYDAQLVVRSNDPDESSLIVPVNLQVADVAAVVNLDPNTLNLGRRGNWVTAYLELPSPLALDGVVLSTLRLNRASPVDPRVHTVSDVDGDGVPDMTLKFAQDPLAPTLEEGDDVRVVLTGELVGDHRLLASGTIRVTRHRVMAPNGGEVLMPGHPYEVQWSVPTTWQPDHADIYASFNGGVSWSLIGAGVPGTRFSWMVPNVGTQAALVRVILFDALGMMTYDSSDQPFSITQAPTDVGAPLAAAPHRLLQNTPNPFRSTTATRIGFELPRAALVRLAIYDAGGHLVRVVVDGWRPAGRHQTIWDGADRRGRPVSSGVYFYQLKEGDVRLTKRMVVLR